MFHHNLTISADSDYIMASNIINGVLYWLCYKPHMADHGFYFWFTGSYIIVM